MKKAQLSRRKTRRRLTDTEIRLRMIDHELKRRRKIRAIMRRMDADGKLDKIKEVIKGLLSKLGNNLGKAVSKDIERLDKVVQSGSTVKMVALGLPIATKMRAEILAMQGIAKIISKKAEEGEKLEKAK